MMSATQAVGTRRLRTKPLWRRLLAPLRHLRLRIVPEGVLLTLVLLLIGSFVIEHISPFDPLRGKLTDRFARPEWRVQFWEGHLLGADQQGRDIFVRLIIGARYSLAVAFIAVGIAGTVGLIVGMVAGYFGNLVDTVLMRAADFVLAVPLILLALVLAGIFGPSLLLVSIALASYLWAVYARIIRAETLSIMHRDFIRLARVAGSSPPRTIATHIFPHVTGTFIVLLSLQAGSAILAEASLSFLGAGIPPPTPAWGSMIAEGRRYVRDAWWVTVFPGIAIMMVVLSFNLLGDWLRDKLDPNLRE